ncbi:MAG TPA: hypothetical protein VJ647_00155, partial [Chitinophagaceae bacterium]|nr:hypothetical protein [Chitinophagaceae bacterium]
ITDTSLINALTPPDGMVIYFVPTKQLMVRSNNGWQPLFAGPVDTTNISNFYQKVRGLLSEGTGISYNSTTGVINNTGVTSVGSGYGLTGGPVTTTGTLLVDSATLSGYYLRGKDSSVNGGYYPYATNPKGYLTGNQTISLTGDVTGSGATSIATTLANSGVTAGTYGIVTVDTKGRVTDGKRQETYSGTTNGSGVYTVTFGTPYNVAPNIQVTLVGASDIQSYRVTSITTTGFTVLARSQALGLVFSNATGVNVDVLITEK